MARNESSRPQPSTALRFLCGPVNFTDPMGRHLLKDVMLDLQAPCLCVITGASGSGKTSLLRAVSGLNDAEVGTRMLHGRHYPERQLPSWRSRVTLLLQDAPCIEGTIEDNLAFPFSFRNSPERYSRHEATRLLSKVGLGHFGLDHVADTLSGGERHRLALVRGILWSPPVLMCDEPLSGLEPELAERCFGLLSDYSRNRPAIVICVLHQERFAARADIALRLEDGTLHRT